MKAITTENICPPIPIRNYDWMATREDYDEGDPVGHGETEEEAVQDLLEWESDME